jgi:hypothetical protein
MLSAIAFSGFLDCRKEFPYFCGKYTEIHLLNIPPWGIMLINNVKKITERASFCVFLIKRREVDARNQ